MSPLMRTNESLVGGFPRVSGDEPKLFPALRQGEMFSPRERG